MLADAVGRISTCTNGYVPAASIAPDGNIASVAVLNVNWYPS